MKNLLLFLRRYLKFPPVLLSMVALSLIACFSFGYTTLKEDRPCVVFDEDCSTQSSQVLDYLKHHDFEICQNKNELFNALQSGYADCGIVLKKGFSEKLQSGAPEHCAQLLVTSRTSRDNTFSLIALVGIYRLYAPYLAAEIAANQGLPSDLLAINDFYEHYDGTVPKLEFDITDVSGKILDDSPNANLPITLIAISIMIAMGFISIISLRRSAITLRPRFSRSQIFFRLLLPQTIALSLCLFFSAALGAIAGSRFFYVPFNQLLPGLLCYSFALSCFFSLLLLFGVSPHALSSFLALDSALSLFLCPAYWDIALYAPALTPIRILSIPYWLFLFSGIFPQ